jgi:hypothetical protein
VYDAAPLPFFSVEARLEALFSHLLGLFPRQDPESIVINPWHESLELTKAQPTPQAWKPARGGVILIEHVDATSRHINAADYRALLGLSIRYDGQGAGQGAYLLGSDTGLNLSLVPDPTVGGASRLYMPAWLNSQRGIYLALHGSASLTGDGSVQVGLHGWIALGAKGEA